MAVNIYVANLSWATGDEELKELFQPFGNIDRAVVIKDRETERSRGFGFVEMSDDEEAQKAIAELNGKEFDGRPLKVNEARPREDSPRGGNRGGGNRGYQGGGGSGY